METPFCWKGICDLQSDFRASIKALGSEGQSSHPESVLHTLELDRSPDCDSHFVKIHGYETTAQEYDEMEQARLDRMQRDLDRINQRIESQGYRKDDRQFSTKQLAISIAASFIITVLAVLLGAWLSK